MTWTYSNTHTALLGMSSNSPRAFSAELAVPSQRHERKEIS